MIALLLAGCRPEPPPEPIPIDSLGVDNAFPLPDDLDTIDFVSVFNDAVRLMTTVSTQQPWLGHRNSIAARTPGCPDFWTGTVEDAAGTTIGHDDGVMWMDDCARDADSPYYDGYVWWDFDVSEAGDPNSLDGRVSEASRTLEGDGLVGDAQGVRFEFDGRASDSLYHLAADGYERTVYSTTVDATVTGRDVFGPDSLTPEGYRTDLFMYFTGGDVDRLEARGNVYLFEPQLQGRFDSVGVDMALQGPLGAGPDDCALEPVGWIGVRDADALWYDVVFLPRFREDVAGDPYPNDPLSECDGCGRLYVQGIEQPDMDVCVDFSFLFDEFALPDADEYVLPIHAL
ncbi:MAG: hypothetical protein R3F59_12255 [Myxococcota bacterium]